LTKYRLDRIRRAGRRARSLLAALIAAAVLFVVPVVPARAEQGASLLINEVMSSNKSSLFLSDGTLPDWIELTNASDRILDLSGFAIMLNDDPTRLFRFPSITLGPGALIVVYADGQNRVDDEDIHLSFKLAAGGSALKLLDARGDVADEVSVPALEGDTVYARMDDGTWQVSAFATPEQHNQSSSRTDSPMGEVTDGAAVVVTEVMSKNVTWAKDADGEFTDYIEVTNVSDAPVSMSGWRLSDDEANIARWSFPDITLEPGQCLLVHCAGVDRKEDPDDLHASFKLSRKGTSVILTTPQGRVASLVHVPELNADQAYSLVGGQWTGAYMPTPGAPNSADAAGQASDMILAENTSGVMLSEISASSSNGDPDWIELYNRGDEPVELTGWGLSDSASKPRRWQFPEGTVIQPGQYAGVRCTGQDQVVGGVIHTNFSLSAEGGYSVVLSDAQGAIVDRMSVPQQYEDITYGRVLGEEGFWYFTQPTPLAVNNGERYRGKALPAVADEPGGLYTTGQTVRVKLTAEEGARIYYTLDSTDPTENSALYREPITITETTVLRTRVYRDGYLESFMGTETYLYDVNNGDGVYVVSLVSDPDNLFSVEKGIMIKGPNASPESPYKGANFWQDWEREAHVEVYAGDGSRTLSSGCGVKLHGQYSRYEAQQAFKVIARTKYGGNRFKMSLFSDRPYTEYQSFLLRSSGQDTDKTRMRDSILTELAKDTSVMYQETEICVMYLNGEYWGQYNLRERINKHSICQFEGWVGQEDDIDLVKANTNVMQGSNATMASLLSWIKENDPTTDAFYDRIDAAIDIRNYIEYMAVEIFVGNGDTLNVKRYRNANADGKWRWVLFDLDWAFYVDTNSINRWLTPGGMGTNRYTDNTMFIACMKNPRFRDEFLTYMGEQMATTFSTEHVLELIQERYQVLRPLLPEQLERWDNTVTNYNNCMTAFITYAEERPRKLLYYFSTCEYLGLTEADMYHYFGEAREVILKYAGE